MKSSHTPLSRCCMGWAERSQSLKSPMTVMDFGVGGPDGEAHAFDVAFAHGVRAQHAVAFVVRAFGVEVQLEGCQGRSDGGCLHTAIMALDAAAS